MAAPSRYAGLSVKDEVRGRPCRMTVQSHVAVGQRSQRNRGRSESCQSSGHLSAKL